jgi:NAD(P)-dependent dehydrogenase (short-subunit alcohol dehydrogenase family)
MEGIEGLNIAITGGAGDIGSAMGAELTRLGARVTLIDRKSESEAEPWLARVREHGDVAYVQADVRRSMRRWRRSSRLMWRSRIRRLGTGFRFWRSRWSSGRSTST